MAIFSKYPAKQLADAKAARDKLAERLRDAEIAVTDLRQEAERLALDGATDEALSAAEARTREKLERVATLRPSLAKGETIVADLERERDEAADKALREKTSTETEALARRMTEGCAKLVADAAALADWATRAAAVVPEAGGVLNFCNVVGNEIPAASDLIAKLLRVHAQNVLDGRAPSVMPVPPPAYVAPAIPPKPPTAQLFCLRSIKWRDDTGQQRSVGQFRDAEVPQRLVARALRSGACVSLDDPRRAKLHTQGGAPPLDNNALDLDADEPPRLAEPIMASTPPTFTVVDRGPPKIVQIATRSLT
jgi:hypothetical protein